MTQLKSSASTKPTKANTHTDATANLFIALLPDAAENMPIHPPGTVPVGEAGKHSRKSNNSMPGSGRLPSASNLAVHAGEPAKSAPDRPLHRGPVKRWVLRVGAFDAAANTNIRARR